MSGRRLPPPPHRQLNASWEIGKCLGGLWDTLEVLGPSHTEPLKVARGDYYDMRLSLIHI